MLYTYSANSVSTEEKEATIVWNNRTAENIFQRLQSCKVPIISDTTELRVYAAGNDITPYIGDHSWENNDKNGFLQEIVKIDTEKENAESTARQYLASNNRETEKYSFEILENMTGYTRAGEVMDIAGARYVIDSTDHSIKDNFHYVKIEVTKVG